MASKINNKILKQIISIENFFGINRNYCSRSIFGRIIILIRFLFELSLGTAIGVISLGLYDTYSYILLFYLDIISNIVIVLLALYNSKNFKMFLIYAEKIDAYCDADNEYIKNLEKKHKMPFLLLIVVTCLLTIIVSYGTSPYTGINKYRFILIAVMRAICLIRYFFEYIFVASLLFVLSEQVKYITRRISKERLVHMDEVYEEVMINNAEESNGEIASFDELIAIYTNIKECSNLIHSIFGVQITAVLACLIFYFVILLYGVTACLMNPPCAMVILSTFFTKLMIYHLGPYFLSRSAQTAQNSTKDLRCCLAKLLVHSTSNIQHYKTIRDFLRLVSNRPIKTHAFGAIDIDMSLLPKFIIFFTSYTVIALQFNNIL